MVREYLHRGSEEFGPSRGGGRARANDEARVRYGKKAVNFPSSDEDDAEFAVGARVEVRWRKKWYPALIDAVYDGGGSYEVEWIGDGRFNRVTAASVRAVPASPRSVVEKRGRASSEFCDSDDEVMPAKKIRGSPEGTEKLKAEPLDRAGVRACVRVEAKWNGRYYPASVHRFDKGRRVMWDDDLRRLGAGGRCARPTGVWYVHYNPFPVAVLHLWASFIECLVAVASLRGHRALPLPRAHPSVLAQAVTRGC